MSERQPHWFADYDADPAVGKYGWQPCFQTNQRLVLSLEIWFKTQQECEDWIATTLIGAPLQRETPERKTR